MYQRTAGHAGFPKCIPGIRQTADRMRHEIRILYILTEYPDHPLQNVRVDISRHIAKVGGNISLDQRAEELPPLVVDFLHHPDTACDCDLISHWRRLHDGPQLFGTGTHGVFHIFLKDRVELIVIYDPLSGETDDQTAIFRSVYMVGLQKMPQQNAVIVLADPVEAA